MSDAILIFTFGPIQSFIAEARRASDLYSGSKILSRLSFAAAQALQTDHSTLIYPANPNRTDMPNKLVARVRLDQAQHLAEQAKQALDEEWHTIAQSAQEVLSRQEPRPDSFWQQIWQRQIEQIWEIYWVAKRFETDYATTYREANLALDAVKRTRSFAASQEEGLKDTLSGKRSALHTGDQDAQAYWKRLSANFNPSQIRPGGRERLDAIGAIKRFGVIAGEQSFLSVSSVATNEYLILAQENAPKALEEYRHAIEKMLSKNLYRVRQDPAWPYDGDLLFEETLQAKRLEDSYNLQNIAIDILKQAKEKLHVLYEQIGAPSPYYAFIELDGDSMGERIAACRDEKEHRRFSQQLSEFASGVGTVAQEHYGELIYNGGDDVLLLAPLARAVGLAQALADHFAAVVKQPPSFEQPCSLSAGIAVAHHLYPLDATRQAAFQALRMAKELPNKNGVCVRVLKRSGEWFDVRSPWEKIAPTQAVQKSFEDVVNLFRKVPEKGSPLSGRFAYDLMESSRILNRPDEMFASELKRLLQRHRNKKVHPLVDVDIWSDCLLDWAKYLPDHSAELARWLVFARFIAQGGEA